MVGRCGFLEEDVGLLSLALTLANMVLGECARRLRSYVCMRAYLSSLLAGTVSALTFKDPLGLSETN